MRMERWSFDYDIDVKVYSGSGGNEEPMEIQSAASVEPVVLHESVKVWGFIPKFSAYEETKGTYLEAVEEFWLDPDVRAEPHFHDTHEFFYILEGSATIQVEQEARICSPGDLIRIPRNAVHTVRAGKNGVRALAFSVSYQEPRGLGYTPAELPEVHPSDEADAERRN
jgi:quercetin dioxygenase-like cupin family protein